MIVSDYKEYTDFHAKLCKTQIIPSIPILYFNIRIYTTVRMIRSTCMQGVLFRLFHIMLALF